MGQLIKLQDYVSRYEQNIYLYPSRYVRLKKQQWEKLRLAWETGFTEQPSVNPELAMEFDEGDESLIDRLKGFFRKKEKEEDHLLEEKEDSERDMLQFSFSQAQRAKTMEELKQQFLEQIFSFQMKWASTTLTEKSTIDFKFYYDENLKYFLQRFPDTYLFMYRPVFLLKKAPVEAETILVTPTEVWCISFLEEEDGDVFVGSKEHFWIKKRREQETKILNPLISLNRTEKIVRKILQLYEVDLPIKKIVLSRNGYIDYPFAPYDTTFIMKRNYEEWFQRMRSNRSPLKHIQLKAAQGLLQYSQTTSMRRLEWELDIEVEE